MGACCCCGKPKPKNIVPIKNDPNKGSSPSLADNQTVLEEDNAHSPDTPKTPNKPNNSNNPDNRPPSQQKPHTPNTPDNRPPSQQKPQDPEPIEQKPQDPQSIDPQPQDPQPIDSKPQNPESIDPKPQENPTENGQGESIPQEEQDINSETSREEEGPWKGIDDRDKEEPAWDFPQKGKPQRPVYEQPNSNTRQPCDRLARWKLSIERINTNQEKIMRMSKRH